MPENCYTYGKQWEQLQRIMFEQMLIIELVPNWGEKDFLICFVRSDRLSHNLNVTLKKEILTVHLWCNPFVLQHFVSILQDPVW